MADLGLSSNPINPGSFPDLGPSSNPRWVSRTLSGAEGEPNPNPGSNACGGRMRYAPTKFGEFIVECNTNDNPVPGLDSREHLAAADTRWLSGIESHPWL